MIYKKEKGWFLRKREGFLQGEPREFFFLLNNLEGMRVERLVSWDEDCGGCRRLNIEVEFLTL